MAPPHGAVLPPPRPIPRHLSSASIQSTTPPSNDSLQDIITEAIRRLRPVGRTDCARVDGGATIPCSWLPIDLMIIIAMHCGQAGMPVMRLVCTEWRDALDAACMQLRPRMLHVPQLSARYVCHCGAHGVHNLPPHTPLHTGFPEWRSWISVHAPVLPAPTLPCCPRGVHSKRCCLMYVAVGCLVYIVRLQVACIRVACVLLPFYQLSRKTHAPTCLSPTAA